MHGFPETDARSFVAKDKRNAVQALALRISMPAQAAITRDCDDEVAAERVKPLRQRLNTQSKTRLLPHVSCHVALTLWHIVCVIASYLSLFSSRRKNETVIGNNASGCSYCHDRHGFSTILGDIGHDLQPIRLGYQQFCKHL